MKKKIYVICCIIALIFIIIIFLSNLKENSNTINKLNNNPDVIKDQVFENLNITNVSITVDEDNTSTFSADVTNNSDVENNIETIYIVLKDEDDNIITTLIGYIGPNLKKGDITKINATTKVNLLKATSVEYKKNLE